jgi:lysophospholipase L1-like esterase
VRLPCPTGLLSTAVLASLLPAALAQPAERAPAEAIERDGLPALAAKLVPGAEVTAAYLGGSITAGGGASSEATCWRRAVHTWLEQTYPQVRFVHVDAAKGGTGSDLGVCRLGLEVLAKKPDLVFVEFSVNDGGASRESAIRTMEGIVRQTLRHDPATEIIILHTLHQGAIAEYDAGKVPPVVDGFEAVADHYGLPSLNLAYTVTRRLAAGEMTWDAFSKDSCHPTDAGYAVYTEQITKALAAWLGQPKPAHSGTLPEPLDAANWEDAGMALLATWPSLTGGNTAPDPEFARFSEYPSLVRLEQPGDELSFRVRGTAVGFYQIIGPDSGTIAVAVDGQDLGKRQLWDPWCEYYRSSSLFLASDLADGDHTVTIRVLEEKAEKSTGHAVRIGFVLYRGEGPAQ